MTKMSDAVAAAASRAAQRKPSEDRLVFLRKKIAETRDLQLRIEDKERELRELKNQLDDVQINELPALFDECQLSELTLQPAGNMPAYEAKLTTKINASLPKDERGEQALKKFAWLRELSKNTFTVLLDKEDQKKAKEIERQLKKSKVEYTREVKVHGQTLTAEIRRRYADGRPLPPADLDLLGAYVRPVVTIDKVKEKK